MRRIIIFFIVFFLAVAGKTQPKSEFAQTFGEATRLTEENLHPQALQNWLKLLELQPENKMVNFNVGQSYLNSFSQKTEALPYLEKAASDGFSSNFDPFSPEETKPPVEVYYLLGNAAHLNYKLNEAIGYFETFIQKASSKHYLIPSARQGIEWCKNAQKLIETPQEFNITSLGSVVNSTYSEFSPVISVDENALFFTSRRLRNDSSNFGVIEPQTGEYFEDIYVSYRNRQGEWQEPELLNINEAGHSATVNVSVDGQTLYIYKDDGGDGNIYESRLVGETWSQPEKMGNEVNSTSWETHVAVSADGQTLFFVSDRKGGIGGRDIYRSVILPNGQWSKPLNLGEKINTSFDEDAVFISPDGGTLYFSSKGHNSMGGFDIFTTNLDDEGNWSEPVNIGYPLNTVDDDIFFVTSADGTRGYFSSAKEGGLGEKDIYVVDLPGREFEEGLAVLKGFVVPAENQKVPESTRIYVTNNQTGETRTYIPRARDGVFVAILPPCVDYNIDYRIDGESIHSEYITVPCEAAYQEFNKEILLDPVNLRDSRVTTLSDEETSEVVQKKETKDGTTTVTTTQGEDTYTTNTPEGTTVFDKKYGYNENEVDLEETRFILFMNDVAELIKINGQVEVSFEGSASKVPTKTYKTNQNLANIRAEQAREKFMSALKDKGIDMSKIKTGTIEGKVQGPSYQYDYKNEDKYKPFQYIKITAR